MWSAEVLHRNLTQWSVPVQNLCNKYCAQKISKLTQLPSYHPSPKLSNQFSFATVLKTQHFSPGGSLFHIAGAEAQNARLP